MDNRKRLLHWLRRLTPHPTSESVRFLQHLDDQRIDDLPPFEVLTAYCNDAYRAKCDMLTDRDMVSNCTWTERTTGCQFRPHYITTSVARSPDELAKSSDFARLPRSSLTTI